MVTKKKKDELQQQHAGDGDNHGVSHSNKRKGKEPKIKNNSNKKTNKKVIRAEQLSNTATTSSNSKRKRKPITKSCSARSKHKLKSNSNSDKKKVQSGVKKKEGEHLEEVRRSLIEEEERFNFFLLEWCAPLVFPSTDYKMASHINLAICSQFVPLSVSPLINRRFSNNEESLPCVACKHCSMNNSKLNNENYDGGIFRVSRSNLQQIFATLRDHLLVACDMIPPPNKTMIESLHDPKNRFGFRGKTKVFTNWVMDRIDKERLKMVPVPRKAASMTDIRKYGLPKRKPSTPLMDEYKTSSTTNDSNDAVKAIITPEQHTSQANNSNIINTSTRIATSKTCATLKCNVCDIDTAVTQQCKQQRTNLKWTCEECNAININRFKRCQKCARWKFGKTPRNRSNELSRGMVANLHALQKQINHVANKINVVTEDIEQTHNSSNDTGDDAGGIVKKRSRCSPHKKAVSPMSNLNKVNEKCNKNHSTGISQTTFPSLSAAKKDETAAEGFPLLLSSAPFKGNYEDYLLTEVIFADNCNSSTTIDSKKASTITAVNREEVPSAIVAARTSAPLIRSSLSHAVVEWNCPICCEVNPKDNFYCQFCMRQGLTVHWKQADCREEAV